MSTTQKIKVQLFVLADVFIYDFHKPYVKQRSTSKYLKRQRQLLTATYITKYAMWRTVTALRSSVDSGVVKIVFIVAVVLLLLIVHG